MSFEDAVSFHDIAVTHYGLSGFPNPGYLASAVAAPQHTLYYEDGGVDLFDLAAVYLYHIAKGHAFTDGNKRTGYISAIVFLGINGINILLPENIHDLADATIAVADGKATKTDVAALMRSLPRYHPEG